MIKLPAAFLRTQARRAAGHPQDAQLTPLGTPVHFIRNGLIAFTRRKAWSSGELRDVPSKKWRCRGGNRRTGEQVFDATWNRFFHSKYGGVRTTVGTIFRDASEAGWADHEPLFAVLEDDMEGGA
jgi:hypothetical protein